MTLDPLERYAIIGARNSKIYRFYYNEWTSHIFRLDFTESQPGSSSATPPQAFSGHSQAITCVAIAQHGSVIISGSADGSVIAWDPYSCTPLRTFVTVKGIFDTYAQTNS